MELRHFRYFVTLAEELNFTRAARRLNIAQPPLSQQIQQLERELGVQLFSRTNRRVELTYAGQVFLVEARAALEQADRAVSAARRAEGNEFGSLTVGAGVVPIYSVLSKVVSRFHKQFPGVDFRVRELIPSDQVRMMREGGIDVGFIIPPAETSGLNTTVIMQDELSVLLPAGHKLAKKRSVAVSELTDERFIMPDRHWAPTYFDHIVALCRQASFSANIVHEAQAFQTMVALVGAGLGVAVVPTSLRSVGVDDVESVPLRSSVLPVMMIWRPADRSSVVAAFIELVESTIQGNHT